MCLYLIHVARDHRAIASGDLWIDQGMTDIKVLELKRNVSHYFPSSWSNLELRSYYPNHIKQFISRNQKSESSLLNQIPLFEGLGYFDSITKKLVHLNLNKVVKQYCKEELETGTWRGTKSDKCFTGLLHESLKEPMQDPHELMDPLDTAIFNPHGSLTEPVLPYLNSFYEFTSIQASENLEIHSFKISHDKIKRQYSIVALYTLYGASYVIQVTESLGAAKFPIVTYIEYNQCIIELINIITQHEIFGRGRFYSITADDEFSCGICLSDKNEAENPIRLYKCGHGFCQECFMHWLNVNPVCPYCMCKVSTYKPFPPMKVYENMFLSKFWKFKMLVYNAGVFSILTTMEQQSIFKKFYAPNYLIEFISSIFNELKHRYQEKPLRRLMTSKHQIAIDYSLSYTQADQPLQSNLLALLFLAFGQGKYDYRYKCEVLLFLGDYCFRDPLQKFGYNVAESTVIEAFSSEGAGPLSSMLSQFNDFFDKITSTSSKDKVKQFYRLYNKWIKFTVHSLNYDQNFLNERIKVIIPVIFKKDPVLYGRVLDDNWRRLRSIETYNKHIYKSNNQRFEKLSVRLKAAPSENEAIVIETILAISNLADLLWVLYNWTKSSLYDLLILKHHVDHVTWQYLNRVLDSVLVNDIVNISSSRGVKRDAEALAISILFTIFFAVLCHGAWFVFRLRSTGDGDGI